MSTHNKVWQKSQKLDPLIEAFTIGQDQQLDLHLAYWDVIGSLAHSKMLFKVGLLQPIVYKQLQHGLKNILKQIEQGNFTLDTGVEDVHSQVELQLTRLNPEAGARLHTGRSRNDQIALDLRLFSRAQIKELVQNVDKLFELLLQLSEQYRDVLMPGYTHFQIAMVSSFGLWFAAYAESLVDDLLQLQAAYRIVNKNPLGSAAGYGSAFPLDRSYTTQLLGFDDLNVNSIYAQLTRGKMERVVSQALAGLAETLSKLAMDLVLFQSPNFAFVHFPESITTGSSIMPHKKNPDVFEILRARCNQLKSLPVEIQLITTNLPMGYHRDFQILKERFLPAFFTLNQCVQMVNHVLPKIQINKNILDRPKYRLVFTVEAVNDLVKQGLPFREAYHRVAKQVEQNQFKAGIKIHHTHIGSVGNLRNDLIKKQMKALRRKFNFARWISAIEQLIHDDPILNE